MQLPSTMYLTFALVNQMEWLFFFNMNKTILKILSEYVLKLLF